MKNAISKSNPLAHLLKATAAALLFIGVLSAAPAQAADTKPKDIPVEVKYLGTVNGKPLFQIAYSNATGEEVALTLRDENGNVIYMDNSKEKTYSRRLQFNDIETANMKLKLTLRIKKESQTQSYEITKSTRVIEDIAIVTL